MDSRGEVSAKYLNELLITKHGWCEKVTPRGLPAKKDLPALAALLL